MSLDRRSFLRRSAARRRRRWPRRRRARPPARRRAAAPGGAPRCASRPVRRRPPGRDRHPAGRRRRRSSRSTRSRPTAPRCSRRCEALAQRARELTRARVVHARGRRPAARLGHARRDIAPDALTVTIGFGALAVRRPLRAGRKRPAGLTTMPAFPDDDARPGRAARRRARADLAPAPRHGRARAARADAPGARRVRAALDDRRLPERPARPDRPQLPAQPVRLPRRHRQPDAAPTRDAAGVAGAASAGVGGRRHLPGRARDPHARRVLGPRRPARAGEHDRPHARHRRAARRHDGVRGPALRPRPEGRADPARRPHPARQPAHAEDRADQRILRRGFNYHRGFDEAGQLDQGLVFVAFNRDIERQFATIQKRLAGEPMVDYITPVGGGYFFAPRGARGPSDWVGSGLALA